MLFRSRFRKVFPSHDTKRPDLLLVDASALKLTQVDYLATSEMNNLPSKMTLEVVYGHAWAIGKHLAKAQDKVAYIDLNQIGRKTRPGMSIHHL